MEIPIQSLIPFRQTHEPNKFEVLKTSTSKRVARHKALHAHHPIQTPTCMKSTTHDATRHPIARIIEPHVSHNPVRSVVTYKQTCRIVRTQPSQFSLLVVKNSRLNMPSHHITQLPIPSRPHHLVSPPSFQYATRVPIAALNAVPYFLPQVAGRNPLP
jgi:hypothetical protein